LQEGENVGGADVGSRLGGPELGAIDGQYVGNKVGCALGSRVGLKEGVPDGYDVGCGEMVGLAEFLGCSSNGVGNGEGKVTSQSWISRLLIFHSFTSTLQTNRRMKSNPNFLMNIFDTQLHTQSVRCALDVMNADQKIR
jgi:hypothetical protein